VADPYLGELRMFSFAFAPKGWAAADGQRLSITQNTALFSLFGTLYGGDGTNNFALPDLRERVPIHVGGTRPPGYEQGKAGGEAYHTLGTTGMPSHDHDLRASTSDGNVPVPTGNVLARTAKNIYTWQGLAMDRATLRDGTVRSVGGGQWHENTQPVQHVNWCVAVLGVVPTEG
jgi:microcystin-dependent protein